MTLAMVDASGDAEIVDEMEEDAGEEIVALHGVRAIAEGQGGMSVEDGGLGLLQGSQEGHEDDDGSVEGVEPRGSCSISAGTFGLENAREGASRSMVLRLRRAATRKAVVARRSISREAAAGRPRAAWRGHRRRRGPGAADASRART